MLNSLIGSASLFPSVKTAESRKEHADHPSRQVAKGLLGLGEVDDFAVREKHLRILPFIYIFISIQGDVQISPVRQQLMFLVPHP